MQSYNVYTFLLYINIYVYIEVSMNDSGGVLLFSTKLVYYNNICTVARRNCYYLCS